jgi:hypothetical protein
MTLKEYLSQNPPTHRPPCSVEVRPDECYQIYDHPYKMVVNRNMKNVKIVTLKFPHIKVGGGLFTYMVIDKEFWTMDEHGNPQKRSVFKFV